MRLKTDTLLKDQLFLQMHKRSRNILLNSCTQIAFALPHCLLAARRAPMRSAGPKRGLRTCSATHTDADNSAAPLKLMLTLAACCRNTVQNVYRIPELCNRLLQLFSHVIEVAIARPQNGSAERLLARM
jgi:hypothetical protein